MTVNLIVLLRFNRKGQRVTLIRPAQLDVLLDVLQLDVQPENLQLDVHPPTTQPTLHQRSLRRRKIGDQNGSLSGERVVSQLLRVLLLRVLPPKVQQTIRQLQS